MQEGQQMKSMVLIGKERIQCVTLRNVDGLCQTLAHFISEPNQKQANTDKIISSLFLACIFIIPFQSVQNTPNISIHFYIFTSDVEFLSS